MTLVEDVAKLKENFERSVHGVIDALVRRILKIGPGVAPYLTDSGFWLGFEVQRTRRGSWTGSPC